MFFRKKPKATFLNDPLLKNIPEKDGIFYPKNLAELITLIDYARDKKIVIRTLGSEHSPKDAIYAQVDNQINVKLDGDFKNIQSFEIIDEDHARVKVGAGCYLGINPRDKNSTKENSFTYQIDQKSYALPTLGGISHQTIAGFLQTSSSGGSAKHSIADVIEEIELINGEGKICRFKKGEDEFNAAVVSMGLFGIITSVTFNLPKKYLVEGLEENKLLKDSYLAQDAEGNYSKLTKALFEDNEYIHINWLPQENVNRAMQWTGHAVQANTNLLPYHHPLESRLNSFLAAGVLALGNLLDNLGSHTINLKLKSWLLKPFANLNDKQIFRDVWYRALPIDDLANVDGLINTSFSELWFPKERLNEVMSKLTDLFAKDKKAAGNFIVELYCAKESPFWLSPSYQNDSFRVDLYWWKYNKGSQENYFAKFWQTLLTVPGARLHWGKYLPDPNKKYGDLEFNSDYLKKVYPKLSAWLSLREKMDPEQIFVSDYWRNIFKISKVDHEVREGIINLNDNHYTKRFMTR